MTTSLSQTGPSGIGRLARSAGLAPTLDGRPDILTDVEAFSVIRRRSLAILRDIGGYADAEDFAAELWLTVSRLSGIPGYVRADFTSAGYVQSAAKRWRVDRARERTEAADLAAPGRLQDQDFTYPEHETAAASETVEPVAAYALALTVADRLSLPTTAPVIACLTAGLTDATADETAAALGVKVAAWRKRVVQGSAAIRAAVDPATVADALADVLTVRRTVPLERRRIGYQTSDVRAADILLARPPRYGRLPDVPKLPGHKTVPAPALPVTYGPADALGYGRDPAWRPYGPASTAGPIGLFTVPDAAPTLHGRPADVLRWIEVHLDGTDDEPTTAVRSTDPMAVEARRRAAVADFWRMSQLISPGGDRKPRGGFWRPPMAPAGYAAPALPAPYRRPRPVPAPMSCRFTSRATDGRPLPTLTGRQSKRAAIRSARLRTLAGWRSGKSCEPIRTRIGIRSGTVETAERENGAGPVWMAADQTGDWTPAT